MTIELTIHYQAQGRWGPGQAHGPGSSLLHSGVASPCLLESRESPTPVGVGGVMMMLGTTLRCLSFSTGASSWLLLLLLLLLTHVLKPFRQEGFSPMASPLRAASWGALGADAGDREGHQATRLQPWAAGVMARPALPATALASAPARHLEGGAARAAPPHSPPRAQPQPLPPRLPGRLPHPSRALRTRQSLGIGGLSPVLWKGKGRPAPPLVQRRRGNAPSSSLQLGGSGGIVTRGLPHCWVLAF